MTVGGIMHFLKFNELQRMIIRNLDVMEEIKIGNKLNAYAVALSDNYLKLPIKKVACCNCDGEGKISMFKGEVYIAEEFNELDEDFRTNYMNDVYMQICEVCKGHGRVPTAEVEHLSESILEDLYNYFEDAEAALQASYYEALGEQRSGA